MWMYVNGLKTFEWSYDDRLFPKLNACYVSPIIPTIAENNVRMSVNILNDFEFRKQHWCFILILQHLITTKTVLENGN